MILDSIAVLNHLHCTYCLTTATPPYMEGVVLALMKVLLFHRVPFDTTSFLLKERDVPLSHAFPALP